MNTEDVQEVIQIAKVVVKAMLEDGEVQTLQAQLSKRVYDEHVKAGFTESQALHLTCASMKAMK